MAYLIAVALAAGTLAECLPLPQTQAEMQVILDVKPNEPTVEVWHCELQGTATTGRDLDLPTI